MYVFVGSLGFNPSQNQAKYKGDYVIKLANKSIAIM